MTQLSEETFEQIINTFDQSPVIDISDADFIDPFGMVGILEIGEILKEQGVKKTLCLPHSGEVIKYSKGWFLFAGEYYNLEPLKHQIRGSIAELILMFCLRLLR